MLLSAVLYNLVDLRVKYKFNSGPQTYFKVKLNNSVTNLTAIKVNWFETVSVVSRVFSFLLLYTDSVINIDKHNKESMMIYCGSAILSTGFLGSLC